MVPLQLPIGSEKEFRGVVDLVTMKALMYTPDGDGRAKVEEIPAALADEAKEAHEKLVEMVAEGDDKLMEEFFDEGHAAGGGSEERDCGWRFGASGIFPVMLSSALHNIGSDAHAEFHRGYFSRSRRRGETASGSQEAERQGRDRSSAKIADSRAGVGVRVQDAGGPVCRAHQLFQGDVRRAEERRDAHEFQSRLAGAFSARAGDAGEDRRRKWRNCTPATSAPWPN